jgi:hypothetical protein
MHTPQLISLSPPMKSCHIGSPLDTSLSHEACNANTHLYTVSSVFVVALSLAGLACEILVYLICGTSAPTLTPRLGFVLVPEEDWLSVMR